eukprot:5469200-Ditylum_brightwellii.AAC.1
MKGPKLKTIAQMTTLLSTKNQGGAMLSSGSVSENSFVEADTASLAKDNGTDFDNAAHAVTRDLPQEFTTAPGSIRGLNFKTAAQIAALRPPRHQGDNPFVEADVSSPDEDENVYFDAAAPAATSELAQQHTEKRKGLKFKTAAQMAALRSPQHQGEAMLSSSAMSENPFVEAGTASLGEDSDIDFDAAPPADTERRSGFKFKTVAQMAALATSGNPF